MRSNASQFLFDKSKLVILGNLYTCLLIWNGSLGSFLKRHAHPRVKLHSASLRSLSTYFDSFRGQPLNRPLSAITALIVRSAARISILIWDNDARSRFSFVYPNGIHDLLL